MERCLREIANIEALILSGHPDLEGLCLALSDWSAELRLRQMADADTRSHSPKHNNPNEGDLDAYDPC